MLFLGFISNPLSSLIIYFLNCFKYLWSLFISLRFVSSVKFSPFSFCFLMSSSHSLLHFLPVFIHFCFIFCFFDFNIFVVLFVCVADLFWSLFSPFSFYRLPFPSPSLYTFPFLPCLNSPTPVRYPFPYTLLILSHSLLLIHHPNISPSHPLSFSLPPSPPSLPSSSLPSQCWRKIVLPCLLISRENFSL